MNNTLLIISREYLTRVKKKSFIILTLVVPILFAALMVVPVLLATKGREHVNVMVVDENEIYINNFIENDKTSFSYRSGDIEQIKKEALAGDYDVVLYFPRSSQKVNANMYYNEEPSMYLRSELESQINNMFFDHVLQDTFNIDLDRYKTIKDLARSQITMIQIDENGGEKESMAEMNKTIGMICGFVIYFFIFLFAGQVLRGVLEEKNNRIVEVLISSVKPIELLLGKIIGIALVGLTQFLIWIVFTLVILVGVQFAMPDKFMEMSGVDTEQVMETVKDSQMVEAVNNSKLATEALGEENIFAEISNYFPISFTEMILCFLFFFLTGYLVYSALFAAVGSAADNETDSNQLTMPITMPLLLTIVMVMPIADNPNGKLAFWLSMIPLTSPVAMLTRLPSGVPLWELLLSMVLMVLFFIFVVWFAAKVYRTGILMYGKKVSWKEIWKWVRYE